jgi:alpha-L-arabinofuranosidase
VTLFILNRDLARPHKLEINWEATAGSRLLAAYVLTGSDLKAVNGFDAPQKVAPQAAEKPVTSGGVTRMEVPAQSYSVYQWGS